MDVAAATGRENMRRKRAQSPISTLDIGEGPTKTKRGVWHSTTRTELVKIFVAGREHGPAWKAFCGGPVATNLWATMASVRAKTHPHDAIALYHRLLPVAAESGTRNARYDEAFGIVRAIAQLRAALNEHQQFVAELDEIRHAYRAKRNFIKLLALL
jgi:hypothetical protein